MKYQLRTVLLWGWLRLVLGLTQLTCAIVALLIVIDNGYHPFLWILAGIGMAAAAASRFLYRGKKSPPDT